MAKRMQTNFSRPGFPGYEEVEEDGMPQPCAMGVPWVNTDTLKTIARRGIRPTGPKGEPLEEGKVYVRGKREALR